MGITSLQTYSQNMRWSIKMSDYKTIRVITNLLEIMLWVSRKTIKNECSKKKIDLSDYEKVSLYIKKKLKCQ